MMELQALRAPLSAVLAMKRCLVFRIPLLEFCSSVLRFLYTFLLMTRIPFLSVVLTLVTLQVLFPTLTRLLESPLRSGIISTSTIGLILCFHKSSMLCLFFCYPGPPRQVSKQDIEIPIPSLLSDGLIPCSTTTYSEY